MARFSDRVAAPLRHRDALRYFATPGVIRHWGRPLCGAAVPIEPDGVLQGDGVQWLGHASCLVQMGPVRILTDPVAAMRMGPVRRAHPLVAAWQGLAADVVLVSHDHRDHLDRATARRLRHATWLVPLGTAALLRRWGIDDVHELDWEQTHEAQGITFRFLPAHHWCRRGAWDANQRLWGSWLIEGPWTVYFAGDTGDGARLRDVLQRFPRVDVALMPIGGCEPRWFMRDKHLNPEDVAAVMNGWPDATVVPIHWGTYHLSLEPLDEPPRRMDAAWRAAGRDPDRLRILPVGGAWHAPSTLLRTKRSMAT